MNRDEFQEQLLTVMEGKDHWAWPAFRSGQVAKDKLHIHLEQEYATYVLDFPVLVGWAYVQCPFPDARRALAENLYEEETGGLFAGRPHPELFLEYPRGLGMDVSRFEQVVLLDGSASYRAFLDQASRERGWAVAAAVATIFLEGTKHERGELDPSVPKRPTPPLREHPLVKHYGLAPEHLALTKAHRAVEGHHRQEAWRVLLDFAAQGERSLVVESMREALVHWQAYRDDVAKACGLSR